MNITRMTAYSCVASAMGIENDDQRKTLVEETSALVAKYVDDHAADPQAFIDTPPQAKDSADMVAITVASAELMFVAKQKEAAHG